MTYIVTALPCEAKPLIKAYNLKKLNSDLKWNLYGNDENIRLILTGTGAVSAASAVSALLALEGCSGDDRIVNIGTCCAIGRNAPKPGEMYLINKITDGITGRDFYPDMLCESDIGEHALISAAEPVKAGSVCDETDFMLYDMEAASVFQAAKYYLGPSKTAFIKLVSDNGIDGAGETDGKKAADFTRLAGEIENMIENAANKLVKFTDAFSEGAAAAHSTVFEGFEQLVSDFRATRTMENSLRQLITYAGAAGIAYEGMLSDYYSQGLLPAKSKKDGLAVLEMFSCAIRGEEG